jgi:hypothetical protein
VDSAVGARRDAKIEAMREGGRVRERERERERERGAKHIRSVGKRECLWVVIGFQFLDNWSKCFNTRPNTNVYEDE